MRWLQAAGHMQCFESSYWCPLIQFKVQILGEAGVCPEPTSTRTTSCTVTTVAPLNIYALIYFWLCWVFAAVRAFLQFRPVGPTLRLWCAWASPRCGLSCCGARALGVQASADQVCGLQQTRCAGFSSCVSQALEHRLNSCSTRAQLLHGTWDLPQSEMEPVSPELAGGFFTTEPPWKTLQLLRFDF